MGNAIFIYGKSGSGKSRSLKNFAEDEIFLVNVNGKRLPFNKKFKYTGKSADVRTIIDQLQKMPCKTAVIDDAGYIMTDMMKTVPEDLLKKFASLTMLGRLGQPEEIAKAALFLASDDASYITGHVLSVNSGMRL